VSGAAPRWTEHQVSAEEAGRTVQEVLTGSMGISRRMIQKLTRAKGILINRRPAFLRRAVKAGDVVSVRSAPDEEPSLPPVAMPLEVVFEDPHLLVVNKPAGLLTHPVTPEHTRTLAHGIAHHLLSEGVHTRVRPVHRLDRDTSGLLVVAKTPLAHTRMDAQLRERTLRRRYLALVHGTPEADEGVVDQPIGQHAGRRDLRVVRKDGDAALTRYRVVERLSDAALVELELDTGRTHQIRVHMAWLGHPLIADRAYGGAVGRSGMRRPALHSWRVEFRHPARGDAVALEAPLPDDFLAGLDRLRAI
jgi:23S rRNA pseudouridine1911/1915/1917 synthase